jgi:hypothetical protein
MLINLNLSTTLFHAVASIMCEKSYTVMLNHAYKSAAIVMFGLFPTEALSESI